MPDPFDPELVSKQREEIEKKSAKNPGSVDPEAHIQKIVQAHSEKLKASVEGQQLSHVPEEELSDDMTMTYVPQPSAPVIPFTGKAGEILKQCALTGEPVFIFRAKDIFSTMVLTRYLEIVESYGPSDHEFQETLVDSIQMFKDWQAANTDKVRYPD